MKQKILVKETLQHEVVSEWVKPDGYNLSCVTIQFPMMKIALNVAFGEYEEFKKFLKKEFDFDTEHADAAAICVAFKHEKTQWHWINIQTNNWLAQDYGTICHELHHFVHFALGESGIQYGTAGEELFAYMQGQAMELVVRAFLKLKKHEAKREMRRNGRKGAKGKKKK